MPLEIVFLKPQNWVSTKTLLLINTLFLQNRGLYEFAFLRDGPYFFKVNVL